jgi:hypothetical protein
MLPSHQLAALAVSILCGTVIPAVVDLLTKSHAPKLLKAGLALALSAAAGALSTVTWTNGQPWTAYVIAIAAAFVTTIATHSTGYTSELQTRTANLGVGPAAPPADPLAPAGP